MNSINKSTDLLEYYSQKMGEAMAQDTDNYLFGKPVRYRKQTVIKYLHLPALSITRDYDNDSEYGTGEFRGFLVSIKWVKTFIPVGKEVIKVPIFKRHKKDSVLKFQRYTALEADSLLNDMPLVVTGREEK
mgnify:CR=1 FL=1